MIPRPLLLLTILLGAGCAGDPDGIHELPPPTEHWLDADAESSERKQERRAWFEERHKAPPELDWREIEKANGLAQLAKRNRMADQPRSYEAWVERGSRNLAGRMHATAHSTDGQHIVAGSSRGGVWIGDLGGGGWTPIGDNLYGGAHWLAVVPGVGAGDPDGVLAATDGGMIHLTRDQGASWSVPGGLPNGSSVRRVLVKSDGTNTVFVLMRNANWRYRLYRSTDLAASFQEVYDLDTYQGDLWTPRTGSGDLYLLTSTGIKKSTDNGTSWSSVGSLGVSSTRGELCGSEAGAPRLWAIVQVSGSWQLRRSDDAGWTWSWVRGVSDYWGSLNASMLDADLFAWGGVEVFRTANGGASFDIVNSWGEYYGDPESKLHADVPGIDVLPDGAGGEIWYVSTDGGLYSSDDGLATVTNLSLTGLGVSQYYSTLTSANDPAIVAAGAQDQGFQVSIAEPSTGTTRWFNQRISGDYGHLTSGHGDPLFIFSTYPGFILAYKHLVGPRLGQIDFPASTPHAWMPPVVVDPDNPKDFFFCGGQLYRYQKALMGFSWSRSLYSTHDFSASSGEYVSALVFSPVDPTRAYVATNHGRLFYSSDKGVSWTQSTSLGPSAHYFYGSALLASSLDVDTVWVGGSGYGSPAVYQSTDGGQSFQAWSDGLPDTLVYCLGEAPDGGGSIFAGTENAAYRRRAGAAQWEDITGNQAPVTTYWSVEALAHENSMRFGTYGRGIWDYQFAPAPTYELYGCGVNPSGSMSVLAGTPEIGTQLTLGIDNPLGTQAVGSLPILALSLQPDPGYPCGTALPGFGMAGVGELLVSLAPAALIPPFRVGTPWAGPGLPAAVGVPIPGDPALLGEQVFAQGLLFDPSAAHGVRYGLTEAVELRLGSP